MADTVLGSTSTTANLGIGASVNGNIDTNGDHDWYRVTLTAGTTYRFALGPTGSGDIADSTLALRDASGTQIKFNDDADGYFSVINYTATTSGTYYLDAGGYDDTEIGNFVLSAGIRPPLTVFTNDQIAFQLTTGSQGSGVPSHFAVSPGGSLSVNLTALTASGQTLARTALSLWSDVTGIQFTETSGAGQITFDDADDGAYTATTTTGSAIISAAVNISTQWLIDYGTGTNTYSMQTYIHEIGHALGIGHAGDYNDTASYPDDALFLNDSWATSVMSYFSQTDNSYFVARGFSEAYVLTPMAADIIAMQQLYGAATTTRTGNNVYGFNSNAGRAAYDASANPQAAYTVVDNGGVDKLDYSGFVQDQIIDLAPEAFSSVGGKTGNVSIARGTIIENAASGGGADRLYGNDVANDLSGGAGNDFLNGRGGLDILRGGNGDDSFLIDAGSDYIVEGAGGGKDTVFAAISYALNAGAAIESLSTASFAATTAINLTGNEFDQILYGNAGANTLNGKGGIDFMFGWGGNDVYIVDNIGDRTYEAIGGGQDTVNTSVSFTLAAGMEIEVLAVIAPENTSAITLNGNEFAQSLYGNDGANYINGGGGGDIMQGRSGDDTYIVRATNDRIIEQALAGRDIVYSFTNYILTAGSEVEILSAISQGATTGLNLTGNELGQTIYGNAGVNQLGGGGGNDVVVGLGGDDVLNGGAGNDRLIGGIGNDIADFAGLRSSYQITVSNGLVTVVDLNAAVDGNDGTDTVSEVETLRFKNGETVSVASLTSSPLSKPASMASIDRQLIAMTQDVAAFGASSGEGDYQRRFGGETATSFYAIS